MFKNLKDILTADCEVIKFDDENFFYPIFKNGRSSLTEYAKKNNLAIFKNKKIASIKKKITIFLRSPKERFLSGIYTFFYLTNNQIIDKEVLKKIENFETVNRHFMPQFLWLLHLYKYFNGPVELKPITELYKFIPNRDHPVIKDRPWRIILPEEKKLITSINYKNYIDIDKILIKKYINRCVKLKKVIQDLKNEMS